MEQQAQQVSQAQPDQTQPSQPEVIGREDPLADLIGGRDPGQVSLAELWSDEFKKPQPETEKQQPEAEQRSEEKPEEKSEEKPEEKPQPESEEQPEEELLPEPVLRLVDEFWPGEVIETPEQFRAKLEHLRDLEQAAGLLESELPDEMWTAIEQYVQQVQELESRLGRELGNIERKRLFYAALEESGVLNARPPDPNEDPEGYARWIETEALRRAETQKAIEEQKRQAELEARREQRLEALAREFRERNQLPDEEYESFIQQVQRLLVGDPETGELPRRPNVFEVLYYGLKAISSSERSTQRASGQNAQRPVRRPPDLTGQSAGPRPQPEPQDELDYLLRYAEQQNQDPWAKIL